MIQKDNHTEPNGCGGQGSVIDPPELRFHESCNEHDLAYAFGGDANDKKIADKAFLKSMKQKAACAPWYKSAYLYPFAYSYYASVRMFGWKYWGKP